ncbi:MAG: glycosyltransferase family 39 protein [Acidobacteria bacterium]|nr:glycosyltransferase family 39 protein [Acidobacteriota bacterium]
MKQESETSGAGAFVAAPRRALLATARSAALARGAEALCALLLCVMSINLLTVVARKSITVDEVVMIPSAYYHLVAGNFQLVHEHPPLSKILAAVPLLFIQPRELDSRRTGAPPASPAEEWAYQEHFWQDNRAAFETISFWTRVPMIALAVALGVLVFAFARELFGPRAAVLAVALYSFEPTVLAHARVVQTDIPAAFGYLLLFYALHRYVPAPSMKRARALGLAGGVAVLAKFSMLIAGPVLAATFLWMLWRAPRRGQSRAALAAHASVAALALFLIIHATYFFHSRELLDVDARWVADAFRENSGAVWDAVRALSYIFPTDFVLGVFWQISHNGAGHPASLLGMHSHTGWWYYFPVAFALKTTLPFLLLSLASLAWSGYELFVRRDRRFIVLLAPFALYTAFVLLSRIDIGVRYYLPAFPFLFILGGALLDRLLNSGRARRGAWAATFVLLAWVGVEALRAYPNQMSYMNQLAWSHPHWHYLSDSNVEWGDDVRGLAEYLKARGETRVRAATLGGYATLQYYGIESLDLIAPTDVRLPETRYVAIGASFLNGSTVPARELRGRKLTEEERINFFDEYRRRTPEAVIGGSTYIFREHE